MADTYKLKYDVVQGDFSNAGTASKEIKAALLKLGLINAVVRKIAIATYEAEMNLAIHSMGGYIEVEVFGDKIVVKVNDIGPGIEDVSLAMTEGWSTASNKVREMGFGAGMGLPNMKLCADDFDINSELGKGTNITMQFNVA